VAASLGMGARRREPLRRAHCPPRRGMPKPNKRDRMRPVIALNRDAVHVVQARPLRVPVLGDAERTEDGTLKCRARVRPEGPADEGDAKPADLFFIRPDGARIPIDGPADFYRNAFVKYAGVDRAELFVRSKNRIPVRVHDLRGFLITYAIAGVAPRPG
jgi:hypothetical protein